MNAVFGVGVYFVCVGIQFVFHHIGRFKHIFAVALTGAYMMFFVFFVRFYFQVYTSAIYPQAMFEHPCGEAIEFLKEQNLGGMYYLDYDQQGYIYYLISRMESPYDFPVEVEMDHYENIYFKLPEEVYEDSSYVVKETSRKFMDKIEESGFRFTKEKIGYYVVYYPEGK
ncbi:MAG: hypothetical protein PUB13_07205, partial [Lachnospiraceae bacterium]|nr:hypothetical protein [Lachnospiraceae bacterium]